MQEVLKEQEWKYMEVFVGLVGVHAVLTSDAVAALVVKTFDLYEVFIMSSSPLCWSLRRFHIKQNKN